jgi:hypothetical protein
MVLPALQRETDMPALLRALVVILAPTIAFAADPVRVELNAAENAEGRCRLTFVIENPGTQSIDVLKLDLALFDTAGAVYRRMIVDLAPVRSAKTIVKTFAVEGECAQLGSILVNEVAACAPGDPNACLDALALSSRLKGVRFYK